MEDGPAKLNDPVRILCDWCGLRVRGLVLRAGKDPFMTDDDLSTSLASRAAGEAAMRDWVELLVERARVEGMKISRRRRVVDGSGAVCAADRSGGRDG